MRKILLLCGSAFLILLQSCYFGAGLVEETLSDNIHLSALNSFDEAEITFQEKGNSVYYTLVPARVIQVGYDENFIIAKNRISDSINGVKRALTCYHIIEVNKISEENHPQSKPLTLVEFESKRKLLNVPTNLKFTIDLRQPG